jgi:hypothetical protein
MSKWLKDFVAERSDRKGVSNIYTLYPVLARGGAGKARVEEGGGEVYI